MDIIEEIGRRYWAMRPRRDLGGAIRQRFRRYQRELSARGWWTRIESSWLRYHGYDSDGGPATTSDVIPGGEQGELDLVQVNHYRSLIRSMLGIATASRPAFEASATNDSADGMAACQLAEQVWDHELERGLESVARDGAERMLVEAEAGVLVTWDPTAGDVVGADDILDEAGEKIGERPVRSGDISYEALGPRDIARDMQLRDRRLLRWVIVQRVVSRWDLAATYCTDDESGETYREIERADGPPQVRTGYGDEATSGSGDVDDQCYVLELYHEDTPAMPGGRYARVVGEYVLEEGPLPYSRLPLVLKSPSSVIGKALGYSDAWDLLGLAKALDAVVSDLITTASKYGQRPVLIPEGSDIDPSACMGAGSVHAPMDPTTGRMMEPKWMDVPEIPATLVNFADWIQSTMQVLSGVNSVVRGDPEASLKSGAALALVQAMAVQHNSAFQAAYAELLRDLATLVIDLYRENARTERLIDIAGDDEIGTVQRFTGEDLRAVRRIRAELSNPLMRTIAGKKELADFYTDPNRFPADPPLTRQQHMGFLDSGRLDALFRASRSESIGIKSEGEALARGEDVPALITDTHATHIREHKALLDGKQRMRLKPEVIGAISAHIGEHVSLWTQLTNGDPGDPMMGIPATPANPALLMATGQQPAPMAPPPMMPGMPPMGPEGPPMPANDNGPPPGAMGQPPPPPGGPGEIVPGAGQQEARMPRPPMNPATGQRVTLPDGAMG